MFCTKCGANVPENQAFCSSCGNKMEPATPDAPASPAPVAPAASAAAANLLKNLKAKISNDKAFMLRVGVVILAVLSILLIFSKGIAVHFDDGDYTMICEWGYYFKFPCDSSKVLPITFQTISVVLVVGAAVAAVLPVFLPKLKSIKLYDLIPAAVAALNLILYIILVIVAVALYEGGSRSGAHPASASWFYMLDLIALGALSFKIFKDSNK